MRIKTREVRKTEMFGTCFYLPLSSANIPASPTNGIVKLNQAE